MPAIADMAMALPRIFTLNQTKEPSLDRAEGVFAHSRSILTKFPKVTPRPLFRGFRSNLDVERLTCSIARA